MNIFRSICLLLVSLTLLCFIVSPQGTSSTGHNVSYEDQAATAKNFIYTNLLAKHDILPSASAVELVYLLNPQLKKMKSIPLNYKLILPKTPEVTEKLKESFQRGFEQDKQYDRVLQKALQDTIQKCMMVYGNYSDMPVKKPRGLDTSGVALFQLYLDLKATNEHNINKALCIELINLISGCIYTLERSIHKKRISKEDQKSIMDLCQDLSFILPTNSLRSFFNVTYPGGRGFTSFDDTIPQTTEEVLVSPGPAAPFFNDFLYLPVLPPGGLRSFRISVQLRKDSTVISDGPDITGRYKVTFYPPALKNFAALHLGCTGLATYSSISLSAAIYETRVLDLRTNRECRIIGSPVVDARSIFRKPGNNIYEIQIFLED